MDINFTSIDLVNNFSQGANTVTEVDVMTVITDICTQIDSKTGMAIAWVLLGYAWFKIVLPFSMNGLKEIKFLPKNYLELFEKLTDEVANTLFLIGLAFVFVVSWIQGLYPGWMKFISISLLGMLILMAVTKLIAYFRGSKK